MLVVVAGGREAGEYACHVVDEQRLVLVDDDGGRGVLRRDRELAKLDT